MKELHDTDPKGNVMPQGMFWRDGIYYVRATTAGRRLKKSTGKLDYKSALRRYHEIMLAWNNQESGWAAPADMPTVKSYWATYRASWVVGRKTPAFGTTDYYRDDTLIATALVDLGHRKLSEVTPTMAQRWAQKRREKTWQRKKGGTQYPTSEGTVTREIGTLQTLFERAIADGHIEKNPWTTVEREPQAVRTRVLSEDEQDKLEAVLAPQDRRFVNFILGTGLRLQEARGIDEQTDLFLEKKQIRVTRKTRGLRKKVQFIPLFDDAVIEVIQQQLEEVGHLWHQHANTLRKMLDHGCVAAKIDHISPHTLRHTFATRYLKAGGDIYILSQLLGHSSVAITEKVYAHLVSDDLAQRSAHVTLGLVVPGKVLPFTQGLTRA